MSQASTDLLEVYPLAESGQRAGMLGTVARLIQWTALLLVVVLLVDALVVLLRWDGDLDRLRRLILLERERLGMNGAAMAFVDRVMQQAHEWIWGRSGLEAFVAHDARLLLQEFRIVLGAWILGLQLFAMRLGVLILALPFFIAVSVLAIADGICSWYLRRTQAGRESGFIYHRAKRAFPIFLFLMWAVYLVPLVPLDPRLIIPPFVLLFGLALRFRVSYFKKYL